MKSYDLARRRCHVRRRSRCPLERCVSRSLFGRKDGSTHFMRHISIRPVNYTRRGVSYPSSVSGLSGRVSTMASDIISNIVGESAISVSSETVGVTCLPRTKVTATCKTNLDGTGLSYTNRGESGTSFWFKTQEMQFCNSVGTCVSDYRTNFNDGTVFVVSLFS